MTTDGDTNDVLNYLWGEVDPLNKGFIYGRDFPEFIRELHRLLPPQHLSTTYDTALIGNFGKEHNTEKIYKVILDDYLEGLIGTSFSEFVKKNQISLPNRKENLPENGSNIPEGAELKPPLLVPEHLGHQKEPEKNSIPQTELYKLKYEQLKSEYEFYKKRTAEDTWKRQGASLNDEYILHEFRKQVNEQSDIILKLKSQLDRREPVKLQDPQESDNRNEPSGERYQRGVQKLRTYIKYIALPLLLWAIIHFAILPSDQDDIDMAPYQLENWWEKIPLLNGLVSYFSDILNDYAEPSVSPSHMSAENIEAYNEIFGIR
ncbi:Mps2p KNAG_0F02030 [Huiozyma naganishii CBS 8797]|uniref:Monopolar spindle protein 2 n=1 Tax=Huiozyma naganishii (strain ATCC MYA-139 / BCRC 22969 / CBS 8797 / KCTC 17520 / NBRC 10181 / NCYC 3082 / Yp74L-3) TaxID=1071383 RepID=J7R7M3_HUIN7|nr:hypothetical protein KNAG_0F02030 [Kazachstania naganishii CBS 8797]CCK70870.1 hypothetical protein KNAG_0F02030 [Kazachstania naganishii CBS 8797]